MLIHQSQVQKQNLFYTKETNQHIITFNLTLLSVYSLSEFSATVDFRHRCQLGPRYEGQLTRMAEPIPPSGQSSSYSLTTLSSSSSTDRRAETDRMVITTRIAVAHHFICRLRRRESCILGATTSQPTLPLHELPPARLVIHRQTSNHERRKGTVNVQSRSGILADFCPRQH